MKTASKIFTLGSSVELQMNYSFTGENSDAVA